MLILPLFVGPASLERYVYDADLDIERETSVTTLVLPGISRADLGGCAEVAACVQGLRQLLDGLDEAAGQEGAAHPDSRVARAHEGAIEIGLRYHGALTDSGTPDSFATIGHFVTVPETPAKGATHPGMFITWMNEPHWSCSLTVTGTSMRVLPRYPNALMPGLPSSEARVVGSGSAHLHVERRILDEKGTIVPPTRWLDDVPGFVAVARAAGLLVD